MHFPAHHPRSRLHVGAWIACAGAMLLWPAQSLHADPKADYASLFGEEEKKVLATSSARDDAAFAAKLLARANDLKDAPGLQRLVLERAVDLGQKDADGLSTAVEAAKQIIASAEGAEKLDWRGRLVDLYAAQYKRATGEKRIEAGNFLMDILQKEADDLATERKYADAVKRLNEGRDIARSIRSPRVEEFMSAAKEMQVTHQTAEKYDRMRERLNTQGGDVALLEQVILGYLLELDDAETAKTLAAGHPDKTWEKRIASFATLPEALSEPELLATAKWYSTIANGTSSRSMKFKSLSRANELLSQFLTAHERQDADRLKVTQILSDVLKQLTAITDMYVVVWNSHHATVANVGSARINLLLLSGNRIAWRLDNISIPWSATEDTSVSIPVPSVRFHRVRVEVVQWQKQGGSLAEIQVFRGRENIAHGAKAEASASFNADFGADRLTDGITTSSKVSQGYWILPLNSTGWAEIDLAHPRN